MLCVSVRDTLCLPPTFHLLKCRRSPKLDEPCTGTCPSPTVRDDLGVWRWRRRKRSGTWTGVTTEVFHMGRERKCRCNVGFCHPFPSELMNQFSELDYGHCGGIHISYDLGQPHVYLWFESDRKLDGHHHMESPSVSHAHSVDHFFFIHGEGGRTRSMSGAWAIVKRIFGIYGDTMLN